MAQLSRSVEGRKPLAWYAAYLFTIVTLALRRLRQAWFMQCMIGLGMTAAIILACSLPLYANVTQTAGLRKVIDANPESPYISLLSTVSGVSAETTQRLMPGIVTPIKNDLAPFVSEQPVLSMYHTAELGSDVSHLPEKSFLTVVSMDMKQAAPHVILKQGRLPITCSDKDCGDTVEVVLTEKTADLLKLRVGSVFSNYYAFSPGADLFEKEYHPITYRVVGLFQVPEERDIFWHGEDFETVYFNVPRFMVLASLPQFSAVVGHIGEKAGAWLGFLSPAPTLTCSFRLDSSRVSIDQLPSLRNQLLTAQADVAQLGSTFTGVVPWTSSLTGGLLQDKGPEDPSPLTRYQDRLSVQQIPAMILTAELVALVLFALSVLAQLLVDDQTEAIAVMRSRGASRRQIISVFNTQTILLGIVVLCVAPLLAVGVAYMMTRSLLPATDQASFSAITSNPTGALTKMAWYAVPAVLACVLTMLGATQYTAGMDVLASRRESSRSLRRPLWQRFYLDIAAIIVALVGYGFSQYISTSSALDPSVVILYAAPLSVLSPLFLMIAGLLLFLRVFPWLLRKGANLVSQGRSALPMLALAQMARAPFYPLRLVLLFAFAASLLFVTLTFQATQKEHAATFAAYQVGADFSGKISSDSLLSNTIPTQLAAYRNIRGVTAASISHNRTRTVKVGATSGTVSIYAVDPATFANVCIWNELDDPRSLSALMQQLAAHRREAGSNTPVPAIIDNLAAARFKLTPGSTFSLPENNERLVEYVVIAQVQHVPTVNDSDIALLDEKNSTPAGILVDLPSYGDAAQLVRGGLGINGNYYWLRTRDDAASLANVREQLQALSASNTGNAGIYDRRDIQANIEQDPLSLNLTGIMGVGTIAILLMALMGTLVSAWQRARTRQVSFALLRALGTTPGQVASVIGWEQGIIYGTGLLLGILMGGILAFTTEPSLVLTTIPQNVAAFAADSLTFYLAQRVLPAVVVFPVTLLYALGALLLICVLSLGIMVWIVSRPILGQALRLNQD